MHRANLHVFAQDTQAFEQQGRIYRLDSPDSASGLNRERSKAGNAIASVRCNGLNVSRDPGSRGGVKSGDGKNDGWRIHTRKSTEIRRSWEEAVGKLTCATQLSF